MKTITLIGTITTLSPVSVALPDIKGMAKNSQGLPMVSAGTLRGWLRHSAHEAVALIRHQAGQNLTVDQHYMLASGVDTARVIKDATSTKVGHNTAIRKANPLISLFGRWGMAGRLSVGSAVAQDAHCLITLGNGSRSHAFNRNQGLTEFVDVDQLDYLQQILLADGQSSEATSDLKDEEKRLKKELKGATVERKAEINARLSEIAVLIRDAKDERVGASEAVQRPLDGFEAIDAGQQLNHRMTLANPTEEELNLLLWSILVASSRPHIGGHRNLGCGSIAAEWTISQHALGDAQPSVLGRVGFNDQGFYCDVPGFDGQAMTEALKSGAIRVTEFV